MRTVAILLAALSLLSASRAAVMTSPMPQTYTSADVDRALQDAEQFEREGKYAQALERHVWYHLNALKYDPAQYGVRLSFALSDWVELGAKYPPALHALRAIRNDTLATYRKNPSDQLIFGEVMSIDFALDDLKSAKALFYEGRRHGSDADLSLDLDRIVDAGELKWAGDAIGDPAEKLEQFKRERAESIAVMGGRKMYTEGSNGLYSSQAANFIKAVAKVRGMKAARAVQRKALKVVDTDVIRNALVPLGRA